MLKYASLLLSNVLFSAAPIALILLYSHLGSVEDSARLGISLAVISPVLILFSMQHGIAVLAGKKKWHDCVKLRIILLSVIAVFVSISLIVLRDWLVLAFLVMRVGDYLYEPLFYERVRKKTYKKLLVESVLRFAVVFLSALFLISEETFDVATVVSLLGILNAGATILVLSQNFKWNESLAFQGFTGDLMLGGGAFFASVSANMPRYFLKAAPSGELAFYSNILSLVMGGTLLFITFNNMIFANHASKGSRGILNFLGLSLLLFFMMLCVAILLFFPRWGMDALFVELFLGAQYLHFSGCVFLFSLFYLILYIQAASNSVLVYLGATRFSFYSNVLYFFAVSIMLFGTSDKTARATIESVVLVSSAILAMLVIFIMFSLKKNYLSK